MRFSTKLTVANAVLLGASLMVPEPFASTWVWLAVVCWYFGLTLLLNRWIQSAMCRSSMQFITAVNGSTAVKMFSSLALVTAYLVFWWAENSVFSLPWECLLPLLSTRPCWLLSRKITHLMRWGYFSTVITKFDFIHRCCLCPVSYFCAEFSLIAKNESSF